MWAMPLPTGGSGASLTALDGTLARLTDQQSDFGGYVDIVCDFTVYGLIPIAVVGHAAPSLSPDQATAAWVSLALMEAAFFVNAAGLFMLSSIVAARRLHDRRLTTVAMPRSVVEGFETMAAFQLFLLFPQRAALLMGLFAAAVPSPSSGASA